MLIYSTVLCKKKFPRGIRLCLSLCVIYSHLKSYFDLSLFAVILWRDHNQTISGTATPLGQTT